MKWNNYSPYCTAANICLFICGQVEVLSVTEGCFYWARLPFWECGRWGRPITVAAGPTGDTWHTGLAGRVLLWHFMSAPCPSNAYMHTHTHTGKHEKKNDTHKMHSVSCAEIGACTVARRIRHGPKHPQTHTLPEDYKHHFVGHQETCCFAVECAWPVTTMSAVNILSLQIITLHWPCVYKPAAGKPRL